MAKRNGIQAMIDGIDGDIEFVTMLVIERGQVVALPVVIDALRTAVPS